MRSLILLLVGLSFWPGTEVRGQGLVESDPGSSIRTRDELERLLSLYDEALESPAYSAGVKQSLRASAARIQARLDEGDFRVGDRVALYVEGEPNLPDTVPVEVGPAISLPLFGRISLEGVLRSEVQEHLRKELSRFIRDPVVRASGLMRVSVIGSVGRPGFYVVPADMLLSEALMVAGGPGGDANLESLRVERGPVRLIEGEALQEAMRVGRTLDQLNLQAGDQIFVPARSASFWPAVLRYGIPLASVLILGVRLAG